MVMETCNKLIRFVATVSFVLHLFESADDFLFNSVCCHYILPKKVKKGMKRKKAFRWNAVDPLSYSLSVNRTMAISNFRAQLLDKNQFEWVFTPVLFQTELLFHFVHPHADFTLATVAVAVRAFIIYCEIMWNSTHENGFDINSVGNSLSYIILFEHIKSCNKIWWFSPFFFHSSYTEFYLHFSLQHLRTQKLPLRSTLFAIKAYTPKNNDKLFMIL